MADSLSKEDLSHTISMAATPGILSLISVLCPYIIFSFSAFEIYIKKKIHIKNLSKSGNWWDPTETSCHNWLGRTWGFGNVCTDLGCQASASFTDEKGKQDGRVESAVVWVCGGKLALSSERRLNNSERKIMQKESVPFNFPWNWKYVAFLLFFFSFKWYSYFQCLLETFDILAFGCSEP